AAPDRGGERASRAAAPRRGPAARPGDLVREASARSAAAGMDRAPHGARADRAVGGPGSPGAESHASEPRSDRGRGPRPPGTAGVAGDGAALHAERRLAVRLLPSQRRRGHPTLSRSRSLQGDRPHRRARDPLLAGRHPRARRQRKGCPRMTEHRTDQSPASAPAPASRRRWIVILLVAVAVAVGAYRFWSPAGGATS